METTLEEDRKKTQLPKSPWWLVRLWLIGRPKDPHDPKLTHKLSLIALLAWVGLGADGLSSSAYGPAEAFSALFPKDAQGHVVAGPGHVYLAIAIALAMTATVFIISYAYSRIIEHFPSGGGGYLVATALLGNSAGAISGCALLVDYVLTITVSIASGGDAVFSLLPEKLAGYKLAVEFVAIAGLLLMNMRGVKESVTTLVPIFMTFLVTHAVLIVGSMVQHSPHMTATATAMHADLVRDVHLLGLMMLFKIFVRAYSLGAGTYTGIEAVSNGLSIMREPRVETGKWTMRFMAVSLALTAGGLLVCYALANLRPPPPDSAKTLNWLLADNFAGSWHVGKWAVGQWFVFVAIFSEAVLLLVAAQTGFIDGPRVMSNMATDSWLPHRFAALSERLTMQNGIIIIGMGAAALLAITRGSVDLLVVMYSINVFVTFSLSEFGMSRFWIQHRKTEAHWIKHLSVHGTGLCLCSSILVVMITEKFSEGAWLTLAITGVFILICMAIRSHYRYTANLVKQSDVLFANIAKAAKPPAVEPQFDPAQNTAVLLVKSYSGLGVHSMLSVFRLFPGAFKNVVFVSVGVVDSGLFKGTDQVQTLEQQTREALDKYVDLAQKLGIPAKSYHRIGTDVVSEASELCVQVAQECQRSTFFAGEVLFGQPRWYDKMLHSDVAYAIQRRIRFVGLSMVILPMLVQQVVNDPEAAKAVPVSMKFV